MPSITKFIKLISFDFYFFGLRGKTMLRGTSIAFFPHDSGTNTESTQDIFITPNRGRCLEPRNPIQGRRGSLSSLLSSLTKSIFCSFILYIVLIL